MRTSSLACSLALLGSLLIVPVGSAVAAPVGTQAAPATQSGPVAPVITRTPIDLGAAAASAESTGGDSGAPVAIERTVAQPFSAIGFTYDGTAAPAIEVRVHEPAGWTEWQTLGPTDAGPDAGSAEAARAATGTVTEPLLTSHADAYQLRVTPLLRAMPSNFTAVTIDPGVSAADAELTAGGMGASAIDLPSPAPAIISRAEWGADENLRINQDCGDVVYNQTIKIGFVHHTASTNSYDPAGAAQQVRGMYAYHVNVNGWCDFGYNFVVDKFGRVYEGRWGGVDRPVSGAHTGGFNKDSFGVSALGNFDIAEPPPTMIDAIGRVVGWKLGLHSRDPREQDTLVSAGGGTDKWPVGQVVTFNRVSGHRDAGNTVCPGRYLYPRLDSVRNTASVVAAQTVRTVTGAAPANQQVGYQGGPAWFSARLSSAQPWSLSLVEVVTGNGVRSYAGYGEPGTLSLGWDLRNDAGDWVRGGAYRWILTIGAGGSVSGQIEVVPPAEKATAAPSDARIRDAGFTPITPRRVYDSRSGNTQPLGADSSRQIRVVGGSTGISANGVQGVALNVTAVYATQQSYLAGWPAGGARPATSALNVTAGDTLPGLLVVPVGSADSVFLYNAAGSVHLVVDVIGYFIATGGSELRTVPGTRVFDAAAMTDGQQATIDVAAQLGLQRSKVTGVVANVTIANASATGHVLLAPAGTAVTASSANAIPGRDVANRTMVATADGRISVANFGDTARVVVDIVGYFSPDAAGQRYTSVTPSRVLDTRYGPHQQAPLGAQETISVDATAGQGRTGSTSFGTMTSDRSTGTSYLQAFPKGSAVPATSDLNPWAGGPVANATLFPTTGRLTTILNGAASTDLIIDIVGTWS